MYFSSEHLHVLCLIWEHFLSVGCDSYDWTQCAGFVWSTLCTSIFGPTSWWQRTLLTNDHCSDQWRRDEIAIKLRLEPFLHVRCAHRISNQHSVLKWHPDYSGSGGSFGTTATIATSSATTIATTSTAASESTLSYDDYNLSSVLTTTATDRTHNDTECERSQQSAHRHLDGLDGGGFGGVSTALLQPCLFALHNSNNAIVGHHPASGRAFWSVECGIHSGTTSQPQQLWWRFLHNRAAAFIAANSGSDSGCFATKQREWSANRNWIIGWWRWHGLFEQVSFLKC